MGYGAAWGGHLSGRQDIRSVRIRYDPPFGSWRAWFLGGIDKNTPGATTVRVQQL